MSYMIDPLTTPTEYSSGANTTLSPVPDVPPGYEGTSIRGVISGLPTGGPSESRRNVRFDLSVYPDSATVNVWFKASTLTNLRAIYVLFASANDGYAAYGLLPQQVGTWQALTLPKGSPSSSSAIDWTSIVGISVRADASAAGPYSGLVYWRDLRLDL